MQCVGESTAQNSPGHPAGTVTAAGSPVTQWPAGHTAGAHLAPPPAGAAARAGAAGSGAAGGWFGAGGAGGGSGTGSPCSTPASAPRAARPAGSRTFFPGGREGRFYRTPRTAESSVLTVSRNPRQAVTTVSADKSNSPCRWVVGYSQAGCTPLSYEKTLPLSCGGEGCAQFPDGPRTQAASTVPASRPEGQAWPRVTVWGWTTGTGTSRSR